MTSNFYTVLTAQVTRVGLLLPVLLVLATAPAEAQVSAVGDTASVVAPDTNTWTQGFNAGRMAAGERPVAGRVLGAFVGGLPAGFLGPLVSLGAGQFSMIGAGVGVSIVFAAATLGTTAPPAALAATAAARGTPYGRGFTEGYTERLGTRRRVAALVGGGVGAAIGVGLLLLVASSFDY